MIVAMGYQASLWKAHSLCMEQGVAMLFDLRARGFAYFRGARGLVHTFIAPAVCGPLEIAALLFNRWRSYGGRGGKSGWTNTVCACQACNLRKGNRLPHEAGMKMRIEPKIPRTNYLVVSGDLPASWKVWLETTRSELIAASNCIPAEAETSEVSETSEVWIHTHVAIS